MIELDLQKLKDYLQVIVDDDDSMLKEILEGQEDYARGYMNRSELPREEADRVSESDSEADASSEGDVAKGVQQAIFILCEIRYDKPPPQDAQAMRVEAENMLWQYRIQLGV